MKFALSISCVCVACILLACVKQPPRDSAPASSPAPVGSSNPVQTSPSPGEAPASPEAPPTAPTDEAPSPGGTTEVRLEPNAKGVETLDPMEGRTELASLPTTFYGKWRLTGSGGGFDGQQDPEPSDGEMIEVTKANQIRTHKSGKVVSTVRFRVARGPSIFGNDNWLIYRGGIGLDVISLHGLDVLKISENHVEGHSWSYQRVP